MTGGVQLNYLFDAVRVGVLKCQAAALHEAFSKIEVGADDTMLDAVLCEHLPEPITMTEWDRIRRQKGGHLVADAKPFVNLERRAGALGYAKRALISVGYQNLGETNDRWRTCLAASEVAFDFPASLCMSDSRYLGEQWSTIRKQLPKSVKLRELMGGYALAEQR